MRLPLWTAATVLAGPVYLDTNVIVAAVVSRHWLYPTALQLMAEIVANRLPIVVSDLIQEEAYWALAAEAHALEINQCSGNVKMTMSTLKKNHGSIFGKHSATMTAARDWLRTLFAAGHPIEVLAPDTARWLGIWDTAFGYMRDFRLAPRDAGHLAIAVAHASTFLTADGDFDRVSGSSAPSNIAMFRVR